MILQEKPIDGTVARLEATYDIPSLPSKTSPCQMLDPRTRLPRYSRVTGVNVFAHRQIRAWVGHAL